MPRTYQSDLRCARGKSAPARNLQKTPETVQSLIPASAQGPCRFRDATRPFRFFPDVLQVFNMSAFTRAIALWLLPAVLGTVFVALFAAANPVIEQWVSLLDPKIILDYVSIPRVYTSALMNFDAVIADYNDVHSETSGVGLTADLNYLLTLGPQALPAIDKMIQLRTEVARRNLVWRRSDLVEQQRRDMAWRTWGLRSWRLQRCLDANAKSAD